MISPAALRVAVLEAVRPRQAKLSPKVAHRVRRGLTTRRALTAATITDAGRSLPRGVVVGRGVAGPEVASPLQRAKLSLKVAHRVGRGVDPTTGADGSDEYGRWTELVAG